MAQGDDQVTSTSQRLIIDALRLYKQQNLMEANQLRQIAEGPMSTEDTRFRFEECLRTDDAVEIAMQEIVVAQ